DPRTVDAVFDAVVAQGKELTPVPNGLEIGTVVESMDRHLQGLDEAAPEQLTALPDWARAHLDDLETVSREARHVIDGDTLCQFDVRHDNLLIRAADQQVVMVDWGMSRRGPWWGDVMVFGLEWVDLPTFDRLLDRAGLASAEQEAATGFLASLGMFCAIAS